MILGSRECVHTHGCREGTDADVPCCAARIIARAWWEGGGGSLVRGRKGKQTNIRARRKQSDALDFSAERFMLSSMGHLAGNCHFKQHGLFRQQETSQGNAARNPVYVQTL